MSVWESRARSLSDQIILRRREFHQIPELGFDLPKTRKLVREMLSSLEIEVKELGGGLVGLLESSRPQGPVIALRADMDAMPGNENTGLECSSLHPGMVHSCGHDAHMAILISAAQILKEYSNDWRGRVKLIFQPAEELVSGAGAMIDEGVMENPRVDLILSLHVWQQIEAGKVGLRKGTMMASTETFSIEMSGKSAHGAMPHEGSDALMASASFMTDVQAALTRAVPSEQAYVLTFGKIHGGVKANVIAERVIIEGTFRALHPDVVGLIRDQLERSLESARISYGTAWKYDAQTSAPPTVNDPELTDQLRESLARVFGPEAVLEYGPVLPAEDFSEYAALVPGVMFFLGIGGKKYPWPHHHGKFDMDESALSLGVAAFAQAVSDLSVSG